MVQLSNEHSCLFGQKITLEEYERILAEKRKALEAFRKVDEEKRVILDKDFQSMHLSGKKERDKKLVCRLILLFHYYYYFLPGLYEYINLCGCFEILISEGCREQRQDPCKEGEP